MRNYNLCTCCDKCPHLVIKDDGVEIGELGNLCTLKPAEWKRLVEVIKKEF